MADQRRRRRRRRQEQQEQDLADEMVASVPGSAVGQRRGAEFAWAVGPELTGRERKEALYLRRMKLARFRNDFREVRRLLSEMEEAGVYIDGRVYHLVLDVLF